MQRVHVSARIGSKTLDRVTPSDIELVGAAMLSAGRAPKTVRNVIAFLHGVFEHGIERGWVQDNPVRRASRPKRRRRRRGRGDADPRRRYRPTFSVP